VTERKRAGERQRILLAELDHRVKNTLATVGIQQNAYGFGGDVEARGGREIADAWCASWSSLMSRSTRVLGG
jgi:hypothetical protein